MKLTRGGEYAILGVLYLAQQEDGKVSVLSTIAKAQAVPALFLAKVFQALAKVGIVKSHRGIRGGFTLARGAGDITMKDVIEAIEGPISLSRDSLSPVHAIWGEAQERMTEVLSRTNFADLAKTERKMRMTNAQSPQIPRGIDADRHGASPLQPELLSAGT
jgi:Rrf2 family iron-sulfur cluster assembly transcriptional regulator